MVFLGAWPQGWVDGAGPMDTPSPGGCFLLHFTRSAGIFVKPQKSIQVDLKAVAVGTPPPPEGKSFCVLPAIFEK